MGGVRWRDSIPPKDERSLPCEVSFEGWRIFEPGRVGEKSTPNRINLSLQKDTIF